MCTIDIKITGNQTIYLQMNIFKLQNKRRSKTTRSSNINKAPFPCNTLVAYLTNVILFRLCRQIDAKSWQSVKMEELKLEHEKEKKKKKKNQKKTGS